MRIEVAPTLSCETIEAYTPFLVDLLVSERGDLIAQDIDVAHVKKALSSGSVVPFLAWEGGDLIGAALIIVAPLWYNHKQLCAKDLIIWTSPAHRGQGIATRLIIEVEKYAAEKGCTKVYLAQSTGLGVEDVRNLYTNLGYSVVGFLSSKRIA